MTIPRRHHRFFSLLAVLGFLGAASALLAQEPGPAVDPLAKLDEAHAAYDQAMVRARDKFVAAIDKRIAENTQAGRLDAVDTFTAQKKDFLGTGTLPQAPGLQPEVRSYTSAQKSAARSLIVVMKAAELALTKAERFAEARQVHQDCQEQEARLRQEHPAPVVIDPADRLQPNSMWRGLTQGVTVKPGEAPYVRHGAIMIRITQRQGDWFKGVYTVEANRLSVEIEGTLGKMTRTRQGVWRDIDFFASRVISGNRGGPIGPATTHKGLIRDQTFEVTLAPFRHEDRGIAMKGVFELQPSAP